MVNSTDQTSAIMDLKINHQPERNTADLKTYSQPAHLKKYWWNNTWLYYILWIIKELIIFSSWAVIQARVSITLRGETLMGRNFCEVKIPQNFWEKLSRMTSKDPSKYSSLEGVLKTSFMFVFKRRLLQKTSSRRLDQGKHIRLGHTSSRRLQDVFKTSSKRLQDVFKTPCKSAFKTSSRVFKTFSRRLQDFFKTSC